MDLMFQAVASSVALRCLRDERKKTPGCGWSWNRKKKDSRAESSDLMRCFFLGEKLLRVFFLAIFKHGTLR